MSLSAKRVSSLMILSVLYITPFLVEWEPVEYRIIAGLLARFPRYVIAIKIILALMDKAWRNSARKPHWAICC